VLGVRIPPGLPQFFLGEAQWLTIQE